MANLTASGVSAMVNWIAQEVIYVGQTLIRGAYGWLRWSEQRVSPPSRLPSQSPSVSARESDSGG